MESIRKSHLSTTCFLSASTSFRTRDPSVPLFHSNIKSLIMYSLQVCLICQRFQAGDSGNIHKLMMKCQIDIFYTQTISKCGRSTPNPFEAGCVFCQRTCTNYLIVGCLVSSHSQLVSAARTHSCGEYFASSSIYGYHFMHFLCIISFTNSQQHFNYNSTLPDLSAQFAPIKPSRDISFPSTVVKKIHFISSSMFPKSTQWLYS